MKMNAIFLSVLFAAAGLRATDIQVGGGSSTNGIPFSGGADISTRYQQVYRASAFSAISQGGGWISSLAFSFTDIDTLGGSVSNIQINFSTTPRAVDALSTSFSQ